MRVSSVDLEPSHARVFDLLSPYATGADVSELRQSFPGFSAYLTETGVANTAGGRNFAASLSSAQSQKLQQSIRSRNRNLSASLSIRKEPSHLTVLSMLPDYAAGKDMSDLRKNHRAFSQYLTDAGFLSENLAGKNFWTSLSQPERSAVTNAMNSRRRHWREQYGMGGSSSSVSQQVASAILTSSTSARSMRPPRIPPSNFKYAIESLTVPEHIKDANDMALYAGIESSDRLAPYLQSTQGHDGTAQFTLTARGKRYMERQFSPEERDRLMSIVNAHTASTQSHGSPDIPSSKFRVAIEALTMPEHIQSTSDVALYAGIEGTDRVARYLQSSQRPDGSTQFTLTDKGTQYLQRNFSREERDSLTSIINSRR